MNLKRLGEFFLGKARDPLNTQTQQHLALAAFLAWVGLGADGLSSSAYGPEEAFKALGIHTDFGLYLAVFTAITVFIISLAYNQIIELFPTGGGGYRTATSLLGKHAGLVSGAALVVDYVLTIGISVASCVDALFSLIPVHWQPYKQPIELLLAALLMFLNLRGAKESIKILLPIFMGFIITHLIIIVYGIVAHASGIPELIPNTWADTQNMAKQTGWLTVVALFMTAYSLGGGTYTGIEAVSNNVQSLKEPREKTGKVTMLYMAISLAFTAGGIILLYLLWNAKPVEGQTLNTVVFRDILAHMGFSNNGLMIALTIVMAFQGGLLLVAANAGFLGGPSVLANMAADSWVPHKFRYLSSRLVTQNGIVLMGLAAIAILYFTEGKVEMLVVLYSINVFITFSLSLAGLCWYWIKHRTTEKKWFRRLCLSATGLLVTASILVVTIVTKFHHGGWITLLITGLLIGLCLVIQNHYKNTKSKIKDMDAIFANLPAGDVTEPPILDKDAPTAVFMVGSSRGGGMHAILWVQRLFPDQFKNFVFINARTVDAQAYGGRDAVAKMQKEANELLDYFVKFSQSHGIAATSYLAMGIDPVAELDDLTDKVSQEFPRAIFFTSKLVFTTENWLTRLLHNEAAISLQRRLHLDGKQMVILPMKI